MKIGSQLFVDIPNAKANSKGLITCPAVIIDEPLIFPEVLTALPIDFDKNEEFFADAYENRETVIAVYRKPDLPIGDHFESFTYPIGCEFAIGQIGSGYPDQAILVQGRRRVEIISFRKNVEGIFVTARVLPDTNTEDTEDLTQVVIDLYRQVVQTVETMPDEIIDVVSNMTSSGSITDVIASTIQLNNLDKYKLLSNPDVHKRLEGLAIHLTRELKSQAIRQEITDTVQDEMMRTQREMYLREQLRIIQSELGEDEMFGGETREIQEKLESTNLPEEVRDKVIKELARLRMTPSISPESGIIRTYIDWLLAVPWNTPSRDHFDIRRAQKILDADHYGLELVKERILEYIAVKKLAGEKMKSPILCFVGPPGVGKTSLGESIARALGREFVRVSLGGVHDEAEIRGHRRTYIGALPGRIIQTMRKAGTSNPVFMLDEIDKLGQDFRGDPAAALLEVLDPEQNNTFEDHYLDVPYDLSKVMFITTANDLYPIPEALEDRMEVIEFMSYTEEDKVTIAKRYLIPRAITAHGLDNYGLSFRLPAIREIIHQYTYESGVRNLQREIDNICRKIAKKIALEEDYPTSITVKLVHELLGPDYIIPTRANRRDSVGLVTGLVWTSGGGDIQTIEVSLLPGKSSLILTGQLGDVLQESAQIALSYTRSMTKKLKLETDDFENYDIHIHMPEGSVPKDGPSAGVTLATAIISAFTERKVKSSYAMTGEITLRGYVLPVGGVKEKVLAARRHRIRNIILPKDNEKDLEKLPANVKADLEITYVRRVDEILKQVLLPAPKYRQRDLERELERELERAIEAARQEEDAGDD